MNFETAFERIRGPVPGIGLGGEGVLRTYHQERKALEVIGEARFQGIAYFDSAPAYSGSEGYLGVFWRRNPKERKSVFQASKSAERDYAGARRDLENTLSTMGIDHLDLWQIHDLRTPAELAQVQEPEGALQAFQEARDAGLARFIGVTGHHDPNVLTRAVESWDLDTVLLPVNPVEGILGGFMDTTAKIAREKGMAVLGMKILGGSHYINPQLGVTAELLIRYALSQDITLATIGCFTPEEVSFMVSVGKDSQRMSDEEQQRFLEIFNPYVRRLAFYRGYL